MLCDISAGHAWFSKPYSECWGILNQGPSNACGIRGKKTFLSTCLHQKHGQSETDRDRERDCFVCKIFNMPWSGFHILFSDPALQKLHAQTLADHWLCLVEIDRLARYDWYPIRAGGRRGDVWCRGGGEKTPSSKQLAGNDPHQPKHTTTMLFNS